MNKNWRCKCKLNIVVIDQAGDCPVHPDPIPAAPSNQLVASLLREGREERENILAALGEHPDSPVDIPERIAAIRDEGRAHFHSLSRAIHQLAQAQAEYDPKHLKTCDCHGCRRFRRAFTPNPDRPIYLQLDDEKKKVQELASETCRLNARLSSAIHQIDTLTARVKTFEEKYVHQDLLLDCQDKLLKAEAQLKTTEHQPLALNCTLCGSNLHTDSFHSERCPNGYR